MKKGSGIFLSEANVKNRDVFEKIFKTLKFILMMILKSLNNERKKHEVHFILN